MLLLLARRKTKNVKKQDAGLRCRCKKGQCRNGRCRCLKQGNRCVNCKCADCLNKERVAAVEPAEDLNLS